MSPTFRQFPGMRRLGDGKDVATAGLFEQAAKTPLLPLPVRHDLHAWPLPAVTPVHRAHGLAGSGAAGFLRGSNTPFRPGSSTMSPAKKGHQ